MKFYGYLLCLVVGTISFTACNKSGGQKSNMSSFELGKSYLADGDRLLETGDGMEAKKYFKKSVLEFEKTVLENAQQEGLSQNLGISQYRIRDFDNAIQWLNKAIQIDPDDGANQQYLGYCLLNKSRIPDAEAAFKKAFFLDNSNVLKQEIIDELMNIGELSINLGDNFIQQGSKPKGFEFKKLGMRILAMALEYNKYDLTMAKKIQTYAVDMKDQILIDWIGSVIESETEKTTIIQINK